MNKKSVASIAVLTAAISAFAEFRPNVVVIVADDLGYADTGFQDEVAAGVCTPNLNSLAKDGVVFKQGYSSSAVCSNSRLCLSTGRYSQRWGAYYYGEGGLPKTEYTIAEMMRDAGYRTMKVGKTHLNNAGKTFPLQHGFQQSLGFKNHSWDFNLLSQKDVDAYNRKKAGSAAQAKAAPIGPLMRNDTEPVSYENTTTTEVFGKESAKFIKESGKNPFYLQLEFNAVHTPLTRPPKQLAEKYGIPLREFDRDADIWEFPLWDPIQQSYGDWYHDTCHLRKLDPYGRKLYLAHLELMDAEIGRVVNALKEQGVYENTLIFFSSDNGGSNQSYADNGSINGYKYKLMDGGIRVPYLISWPKEIEKGQRLNAVVTHRDLFATLSEITGIEPKNPLDAKSLLGLMKGKTELVHATPLFWDSGLKQKNWVVRNGDWKLAYFGHGWNGPIYELDENGMVIKLDTTATVKPEMKLFNLKDDPFEKNNLAAVHPEKVAILKKQYTEWRAGMAEPIMWNKVKD